MTLDDHVVPWSGVTYRHVPVGSPYGVLDFRFAGRASNNRWNLAGEATLYLASDIAVALGEFARHLRTDLPPEARRDLVARQVYAMHVEIDGVIDLRDKRVWEGLSLANAPYCFLDIGIARATAGFLRHTTSAAGVLVPSMAFLDHPDRRVLALFLEKLPEDPGRFLTSIESAGVFQIDTLP